MPDTGNMSTTQSTHEHTLNRQTELYGAIISTGVVAVLAVLLRLFARKLSKAKFGLDDFLIILSLLTLGAILYVAIWCIQDGFGLPLAVVGPQVAHQVLRKTFYAEFLYTCLLCLVKYSICAFYWRTFNSMKIRYAIGTIVVIITGWTIGVLSTYLLQCDPIAEFWERTNPTACTVDEKQFMIYSAIPNIATDVALLVLPMFPIWNLKKNTRQKVALSIAFALGAVTLFASITRMVAAAQAEFEPMNISWTLVDFLMWSVLEAATAVVAANLPFLRPLYMCLADKAPQFRESWNTKRSSFRSSLKPSERSASTRYTISAPIAVHGSPLKTHVRTSSTGSASCYSNDEVQVIPVEILQRYSDVEEALYLAGSPTKPTMGVVPESYDLRDLERAVIRPPPSGYVSNWQ